MVKNQETRVRTTIKPNEDDYENFQYTKDQNEDPPEDYNFRSFEYDNYIKKQKQWMYNITCINFRKTSYIKISVPKQVLCLVMGKKYQKKR